MPTSQNFNRIAAQFNEHRLNCQGCEERSRKNQPAAQRLARRLPLVHSTTTAAAMFALASDKLQSQAIRQTKKPDKPTVEQVLGTDDFVFTFVGSMKYPAISPCALIFKPATDTLVKGVIATPFDTGGALAYFKSRYVESGNYDARRFIKECEFPAPEHREYLSIVLGHGFDPVTDYVRDSPKCDGGFMAVPTSETCDGRRWTVEVRFPRELPIKGNSCALIVPDWFLQRSDIAAAIDSLLERGCKLHWYLTDDAQDPWLQAVELCSKVIVDLAS